MLLAIIIKNIVKSNASLNTKCLY